MTFHFPFPYCGDADTGVAIAAALGRVIDPEMALGIVDLGLVYGVEARERDVRVSVTMTSAACPVTDLIVDDILTELRASLGDDSDVDVEVVWDPPWGPERMSERARRVLEA